MRETTNTKLAKSGDERGFTLIELMAVVMIIGVLALVSSMGYRKIILSSKMAEATSMVNAIRVAQEAYRAETGAYMSVSPALAVNSATNKGACYPAAPDGVHKYAWGAACTSSQCNTNTDWVTLSVQTDGPVIFGYTTVAGQSGTAVPSSANATINGSTVTWGDVTTGPWYIAAALGDLDADATTYSTVIGTSWSNQLMVDNDGR